jgi:hypothetical protein
MVEVNSVPGRTPATALPWLLWFGCVVVVVAGTSNAITLATLIGSCLVAALATGRARRPLFGAASAVALAMMAVWVVWSLLIHRDGLGGTVLWVLPAWNPPNGGSFGGAVTVTQLHYGLVRGLRAAGLALLVGLLGQQVAAAGWLRLADATLGRGAGLVAPLLCAGDAYLDRRAIRLRALATGIRAGRGAGLLTELTLAARQTAIDWTAATGLQRTSGHGVLGLALQLVLLAGWSIGILPANQQATGLSSIELTAVWLAAAIGLGLAFHHRDLRQLRPGLADLPALLGAAALIGAWLVRDSTGEAALLDTAATQFPEAPWLLLSAIVLTPLGLLLSGYRS